LIQLVEARKDTSKMLDLVDETLNQVSFTIQPRIVFAQDVGSLMRRDYSLDPVLYEIIDKMGSGITAVSDQALKIEAIKQGFSLRDVMTLSSGQHKAQWVSQTID